MRFKSRFDRRFYATGVAVLLAAIAAKLLGADGFDAYPTVEVDLSAPALALSSLLVLAGLAPLRRRPRRATRPACPTAAAHPAATAAATEARGA
jgi:hypothetical protein